MLLTSGQSPLWSLACQVLERLLNLTIYYSKRTREGQMENLKEDLGWLMGFYPIIFTSQR